MRVLVVSHTYLPGDYRGKLRWLAREGGVDLTLLGLSSLRLASGVSLRFEDRREPFGVRLLEPLAFRHHNVLRLYSPPQVTSLLDSLRPDIVHVEAEPHSLTLALFALLRQRYHYRLVGFTWENIRRRGRPPLGWMEPLTLSRLDWMLAGNRAAAEVIAWRGFRGPCSVVPQVGIDADHFALKASGTVRYAGLTGGFRVGYAGRLVPQKGVMDLLQAFRPLSGQAVLVLLGEGALRPAIERYVAENGLTGRVHLAGHVPYAEMPAHLAGLQALVLPSRTTETWKEQFGHVLAEAMLMGVPVIGSDSGAIPEVIGEAGLLYGEGDPAALQAHLSRLMADEDLRQRLASAGRARALERYTDPAIGRGTLAVYRHLGDGACA